MGIWQTEFLCRKNTVEHRNVGTQHFLQLFSVLTDFVKFAMSTKKEQSNRLVRLLRSIQYFNVSTTLYHSFLIVMNIGI